MRAGRGVGAGLGRDRFPAPILCSLGLPGVVPGSGEAGEGEGQQGTPGDGNRRGKARPEERPPREVPSLPLLKRQREERRNFFLPQSKLENFISFLTVLEQRFTLLVPHVSRPWTQTV